MVALLMGCPRRSRAGDGRGRGESRPTTYGYLASARAGLLQRLGRIPEALLSYEEALAFADNEIERSFLAQAGPRQQPTAW
jgi:predicted RNA polymerase sigma factor